MAPKDFIAARQTQKNKTDSSIIMEVAGQPYYPELKVEGKDPASIRHVVATRFPGEENTSEWPVTVVSGGITNQLFRVDRKRDNKYPSSILVRIFGAEGMIDRDVETATFAALADQQLGPRYYGRFANGRLEEWLDGMQVLTPLTMAQPTISMAIAKQMALLHTQFTVPASLQEYHSEQPTLWIQLADWMAQALKIAHFQTPHDTKRAQALKLDQIPSELEWLRRDIIPSDAPVVFCHNDLLAANILHHSSSGTIRMIDFEYGGINYQAFDIANHFNEYAGGTQDGQTNYEWFPSPQHQLEFLKAYLEEASSSSSSSSSSSEESEEENPTESSSITTMDVQHWYDQIQPFVLANHLYWGLWAVNQAATEGCQEFDYMLFAQNRIAQYYKCKQKDFVPSKSSGQ